MDERIRPDAAHILRVSDLTEQIKATLEGDFTRLWIQGEVSNLRRQSSGHLYFSLKDSGSKLPCVLFKRDAEQQDFLLEEGMQLILLGDISVYKPHGRYQLIVKVALQAGLGRLQAEFEKLKIRLKKEGLFDPLLKKELPVLPRNIAVITSPSGAALRDFIRILKRRQFCGRIVIFPSRVQGIGAANEIESMLERVKAATPAFDLVVLTRGGGSIEDLWTFNEESLARAIADFPLPVISAIGHEIDHVLTDYTADLRAETPSGAAEQISSLHRDAVYRIQMMAGRLNRQTQEKLQKSRNRQTNAQFRLKGIAPKRRLQIHLMQFDDADSRLKQALKNTLSRKKVKLERYSQFLAQIHPKKRIALGRQRLAGFRKHFATLPQTLLNHKIEYCHQLEQRLENTGVMATLRRGFVLLKNQQGLPVDSIHSLQPGDSVTAQFHDGETDLLKVENKRPRGRGDRSVT